MNTSDNKTSYTLIKAGAIADYQYVYKPGHILIKNGEVQIAGTPESITQHRLDHAISQEINIIAWPDALVLPAMVNSHAHLDLSALSFKPYGGSFTEWLKMVIASAPREDSDISKAVLSGVEMSLAQGVGYVGDIAGSITAASTRLVDGRLRGISFVEQFGLNTPRTDVINQYESMLEFKTESEQALARIRVGIQPHSPYSAGLTWFDVVSEGELPASTHLAETESEITFCESGTGAFAELLEEMGKAPQAKECQPWQAHPVQKLGQQLKRKPWLLAHCNYLSDAAIDTLVESRSSIAYCPIASDYFQHQGHAYRTLIDRGINVALGSDSILCQSSENPQPMSMLSQMRHLYRRDGADPALLLKMATCNGHMALNTPEADGTLRRPGGFVKIQFDKTSEVPPLRQILESEEVCSGVKWLDEL